jgi:CubicO group peptidase (beta-lactamase class C family)
VIALLTQAAVTAALCAAAGARVGPDDALERYVAAQVAPDGPGAVVLVARGAEPLLRAAYGLADVEAEVPLRPDQPLPVGSLTKSFTAAAVLRLAAQDELELADDVREHVPSAPVGEHAVTIEQLLTHTSGMPNLVDVPGFFAWAREPRSTAELLARTAGVPFHFEPGTGFAYSDSGYILLGAVLERRTGEGWAAAVRALVARPLGLASVAFAGDLGEGAAVGYEREDGGVARAEPFDWSVPHASGALVATADDLLRWVRAWRSGAVVPAELAERAWAARELPDGTRSGYGYGWKRCPFEGRDAVQHGGWVPGFTAAVLHLPGADLTAVVLSNGAVEATYLARRALRLVLTGSPELVPVALTREQRERLLGRYRTEAGREWLVAAGERGVTIDLGRGPVELVALSPRVLCAADSDGTWCFTFEPGAGGRAAAVAVSLTCEPQARARRAD